MATVPTGYVFWDVSANKSYAAGKTFPALGEGDYLVPATLNNDGYYQQYWYHANSYVSNQVECKGGWEGTVQSRYYSQSQKSPFNTIADKPVYDFTYDHCTFTNSPAVNGCTNLKHISWWQCTRLTSIPTLPPNLESLYYSFSETAITSPPNLSGLSKLKTAAWAFHKCANLTSVPTISGLLALVDTRGMFQDCPLITTPPDLPPNVTDTGWMFQGCTALVSAPTLVASITSAYSMFRYCTSLTGFITVNIPSGQLNGNYCFYDTVRTIILVGEDTTTYLSKRSNNNNVYDGIRAYPASFTAIRCDENGNESASGEYALLMVSYSALNYSGAKLMLPSLKKDGSAVSTTWHIESKTGEVLTSEGTQLQSSDRIVSIFSIGDNTSAPKFDIVLNTAYESYSWQSSSRQATTTYKEFIIDVSPNGKAVAIGREASDTSEGLFIDMPNLLVNYSGDIRAKGLVGMIVMHAGNTYPYGWLPCDGRLLDRVEYAELFDKIGTAFGEGDGSTTFALPDLCGRVPIGLGSTGLTNRQMGDQGGSEKHTMTVEEMPAHTHGKSGAITNGIASSGAHTHTFKTQGNAFASGGKKGIYSESDSIWSGTSVMNSSGAHTHNLPAHEHTSVGGGEAFDMMPPFTAIRFIINTGKLT